ncbi:MAG: undecaprenyldiphospho-muramoylpentapeptide beta-N-acetylglucosaminyltransferase [Candidatus Eisenbacteria bacterium]|nr:undecaprenyldiphospho-muramoylpentapeptide beta-N-acetylglucosaminyltransferase [Candidatus Eisenbacteria bacterium]
MNVLFAGGGTGGHLFPAVAVIEALRETAPEARPLFVLGGSRGASLLERYGIAWRSIPVRGMPRGGAARMPLFALRLVAGTVASLALTARLRPAAVLAMGGYASTPVAFAARLLGRPVFAAEQNAVAGVATRWNARFARRLFLGYEGALSGAPRGCALETTGIPVRREILRGDRARALDRWGLDGDRRTVLVLGGSQGARGLNRLVIGALRLWGREGEGAQVLFQTGEADWETVRDSCGRIAPLVRPHPFLDEMGDAYAAADLVICRAGASTLAEINAVGLPAVLVPFPAATDRHQSKNALHLARSGAAIAREEEEWTPEALLVAVQGLLENEKLRSEMANRSRALGRPDAAERIAARLTEAMGKGKRRARTDVGEAGARAGTGDE